ncbi:MAG: T9SS C-terminal target domain-containing protein [Candidatus Kapaibacterium sp.]|nr:MAG: T9SS C-terminal target domain-containing protein [Candidatus Kapabacteria bacterium]
MTFVLADELSICTIFQHCYMKKYLTVIFIIGLISIFPASWQALFAQNTTPLSLRFISRWQNSLPPQGAGGLCESIAFDAQTQRVFVANSLTLTGQRLYTRVEVVNITNPLQPVTEASLDLSAFGADVSSIALNNGTLVAAMIQAVKTDSGRVVFIDVSSTDLQNSTTNARSVVVGAQPDMITFTPDGRRVLTANEGEPRDTTYLPDPEGSISIIDLPLSLNGRANIAAISQQNVRFIRFNEFNFGGTRRSELRDSALIHFPSPTTTATIAGTAPGRLVSFAQDVEPEYIAVSADSQTAFVTLQENNAWAIIDIATGRVQSIRAMGFKDHNRAGNGLDASDRGTNISIANYPVFGMYQPDAIYAFSSGGETFIASVNEGDTRGYVNFSEEARMNTLTLDSVRFPNRAVLRSDTLLGRLTLTRARGDIDNDGDFDELYVPGGRSVSLWSANGGLVWDSGDQIEQITAQRLPNFFNASRDNITRKNRSDDKGPEPEGIVVGTVGDSTYIFAGLERTGGIMVFNATNPRSPRFSQFISTRDYSAAIRGDVSTEALLFVPAAQNRLNMPLVIAAHEVSGTVSVFAFDRLTSVRQSAESIGVRTAYVSPTTISLEIPTLSANAIECRVSDMLGRIVEHTVLTGVQSQECIQHILNFDGKPRGAYMLQIIMKGNVYQQKLMIAP